MNEFFLKSFFNMLIKCEGVTVVPNPKFKIYIKFLVLDEGQWLFRARTWFFLKKRRLLNSSSKSIIRSFWKYLCAVISTWT